MITYRAPRDGEWGIAQGLLSELALADGGTANRPNEALLRNLGSDPKGWLGVIFAIRGDQPLGIVTFSPDYSMYRGSVGIYIPDLYVSPLARGLRLGRGLILAAEAAGRARWGASFVSLIVNDENTKAKGFYRSIGFTLRGAGDYLVLEGPSLEALKA